MFGVVETVGRGKEKKVKRKEGDGGSKASLGMMGLVELWKRDWLLFLWAARPAGSGPHCMGHGGAWARAWAVGCGLGWTVGGFVVCSL